MPIRQRPYGALAPIYFLTPPQGKGNPGRKNEAVEDHKKLLLSFYLMLVNILLRRKHRTLLLSLRICKISRSVFVLRFVFAV